MYNDIISAVVLGLIGGSVPGPVLTSVFTEVMRIGFFRSLSVVGKGLVAETTIGALVITIIAVLSLPKNLFYILSFIGAFYIFYLSWKISQIKRIASAEKTYFTFSKIFILTFLNGPFWIFWLTICMPMAIQFRQYLSWGHFLFLICFEIGWLTSTVIWTFIFSRFRPYLMRPHLIPKVFKILAIIMGLIGIKIIYNGINYFI